MEFGTKDGLFEQSLIWTRVILVFFFSRNLKLATQNSFYYHRAKTGITVRTGAGLPFRIKA
jgi:hypothetical protein